MALTARDMSDMGRLAALTAQPKDTTREELYVAVTSLYRLQNHALNPREKSLVHEILKRLTRDVEMAIRIALAEQLADDPTAPSDLVLLLANDAIEVARPLLLRSPLLSDNHFLELLAQTTSAHHEAVASRPRIGEPVTAELAKSDAEPVLIALVRNATAKISAMTFETLVEKSRTIAALQEPLVERGDVPAELATRMCAWVSDALKDYIARNYQLAPARLDAALERASGAVQSEPPPARNPPADGAQRLIDKLAASGQLKPGFLLRVLHQGQTDLFDLALAKLAALPLAELRAKFYGGGPRAVALTCRAVGIDRAVFKTVYDLSRRLHGLDTALALGDFAETDRVFSCLSRQAAAGELASLKFN